MRMYRKSIFAILFVFIPFSDSKSRSNQLLKSTQYLSIFASYCSSARYLPFSPSSFKYPLQNLED